MSYGDVVGRHGSTPVGSTNARFTSVVKRVSLCTYIVNSFIESICEHVFCQVACQTRLAKVSDSVYHGGVI